MKLGVGGTPELSDYFSFERQGIKVELTHCFFFIQEAILIFQGKNQSAFKFQKLLRTYKKQSAFSQSKYQWWAVLSKNKYTFIFLNFILFFAPFCKIYR